MKIVINYNKINSSYVVVLNNELFFLYKFNIKNKIVSLSFIDFNYLLLLRILRQFGFCKPLKNLIDF